MARWGFHVGDSTASAPVYEFVTGVRSRSYTRRLVGPDDIALTVDARQAAAGAVFEWASDLWAYRDGVLVARGRVLPTDDSLDEDNHILSVTAKGYEAVLALRFVDTAVTYTGLDQATILWNLVNLSQGRTGGALGITQGTNGFAAGVGTTGVTRTRNYAEDQEIGKLCRQLAEVDNGFDFEIDAAKKLQVYYPSRGQSVGAVLVYGSNVSKAKRTYNWGQTANAVGVSGAAGTSKVTAVSGTVGTDPRGRIEARQAFPSVTEQATLSARATSLLAERSRPSYGWTLTLKRGAWQGFGSLNVGDTVRLDVKSLPRLNLSTTARVHEITVKVGPSGEEDVTVKVEQL